jgi:DNA polymerase-3 subunit beta
MKLSCLQENLARGLSIVSRAVAARSTLPVLSNVLLATDQSRLKLSATNLEMGVNCWIGAKVEDEGAITIPARLLSDFVNSLPPEPISMELNTRSQTLGLRCARYDANIKGIDAQEFPLILTVAEDDTVDLDVATLRHMIEQVAFAAATDESRPVLTGVLASLSDPGLTLAAADGFRLSVCTSTIAQATKRPISVIIPARALQELARISAEQQEPIQMTVSANRNQVFFHMTDIDVLSQLVEGSFPDYKAIIPKAHNTRTVVNTAEFLKAVQIASFFSRDSANIVKLQVEAPNELGGGQLTIAGTSADLGDNVSQIDATVDGQSARIAFNAKYLTDVLGVIDAAQVALETTGPSSPGVIKPVGSDDFVHVIMPMHIAE